MTEAVKPDPALGLNLWWVLLGCVTLSLSCFFLGFLAGALFDRTHTLPLPALVAPLVAPLKEAVPEQIKKAAPILEAKKCTLQLALFSDADQAADFQKTVQDNFGLSPSVVSVKKDDAVSFAVQLGPVGLEEAQRLSAFFMEHALSVVWVA